MHLSPSNFGSHPQSPERSGGSAGAGPARTGRRGTRLHRASAVSAPQNGTQITVGLGAVDYRLSSSGSPTGRDPAPVHNCSGGTLVVRSGDIHDVHLAVRDEIGIRAMGPTDADFVGEISGRRGRTRPDGNNSLAGIAVQRAGKPLGDPAGAEHSPAQWRSRHRVRGPRRRHAAWDVDRRHVTSPMKGDQAAGGPIWICRSNAGSRPNSWRSTRPGRARVRERRFRLHGSLGLRSAIPPGPPRPAGHSRYEHAERHYQLVLGPPAERPR